MEEVNTTTNVEVGVATEAPKGLTDGQKAMQVFNGAMNEFIQKVGNYKGSKKQLQRVLINSSLHPLNKEEFHFSYPEEKELFELAINVASAKFFLMVHGLEGQGKIRWVEEVQALTTDKILEENKETFQDLDQQ